MAAIKPWKDLKISDDYMFKLVMMVERICKHMLEIILGIKIREIRYLEDEKSMKFGYGSKGIRLDVYVEGDDTVFEVEMQMRKPDTSELAKRTRYYQSVIDRGMLKTGFKYRLLKPSFIIFICPFDPYGQSRHIYTFRNICTEDRYLEMGDETTKIFLNTTGTVDDVSPEIKAFLDYVNGIVSADIFVQEIEAEINRLKQLENEEASYMTYAMKLAEEREDGREEGREEGENKLGQLITKLLADGKNDEIGVVAANKAHRHELYLQYGIS